MSLDGLRAWVAEVERKLAKRTRVLLVLVAVAIGIAGASVFLAIDSRGGSVSEGDVRALQEKLEARIDELEEEAGGGAGLTPEAEPGAGEEPEAGAEGPGAGGGEGSGSEAPGSGGSGSDGASRDGNSVHDLLERAGAVGN